MEKDASLPPLPSSIPPPSPSPAPARFSDVYRSRSVKGRRQRLLLHNMDAHHERFPAHRYLHQQLERQHQEVATLRRSVAVPPDTLCGSTAKCSERSSTRRPHLARSAWFLQTAE